MSIVARSIAGLLLILTLVAGAIPRPAEALNVQGLWWSAPAGSEPGTGIYFAHQGEIVLATWFVYDAAGAPQWFVAELHETAARTYTGALARATAAPVPFDAWEEAFVPTARSVTETTAGTLTASFSDERHGTITYVVGGVSGTKQIVPQDFPVAPTCTFEANPDLAGAANYTDLWWNPAEPGWGVGFSHQGSIIFATLYTYDEAGAPRWYVGVLYRSVSNAYAGQLLRVTGPPFGAPYDASSVVEAGAGSAVATFANGNSARFRFSAENIWGDTTITRQRFAPPAGTVCRSSAPTTPTLALCEFVFDDWGTGESCVARGIPYAEIGGLDAVYAETPKPASVPVARFVLEAIAGAVTIGDISAFDAAGVVAPFFAGLSEGMVIPAGQAVEIELRAPLTGGRTSDLRFAFSANGVKAIDLRYIVRLN